MAKKVQPVDILPAPSSSDDETEDEDGSSSETDDEQQPQHPPPSQKPQIQQPQESEEESSDDETEDDEPLSKRQPVVKKPSLQEPQKPQESDDDDEEDESDGDSDETPNSPTASGFTVKPVVSKSPEPKTPTSKPARVKSRAKRPAESEETEKASKPVSKNQVPGKGKGKRPAEVETEKVEKSKKSKVSNGEGQSGGKVEKDSKNKKGDDESGEVEEKKSIIKWSEKDEVALLGGIIEYKTETGEDVNSKVDTFYEYAKDLLSVSLTKSQLYEKIRRLKKKFQTNVEKGQNGEEPVFAKPHESKLFELSQKIWGSEGTGTEGNDSKVKTSKKKEKKNGNVVSNASTPMKPETSRELFVQEEIKDTIMEDKKEEPKDFWSLYPMLCATLESEASDYLTVRAGNLKDYVKRTISRMGEEKARELEDGWKDIHVMDHQLYAKRALLISKQAQVVSELF